MPNTFKWVTVGPVVVYTGRQFQAHPERSQHQITTRIGFNSVDKR